MRNVEKDMLARITSISRLVALAACAIGPAFGGILSQEFGVRGAVIGLFLITAALPVLSFVASSAAWTSRRYHGPAKRWLRRTLSLQSGSPNDQGIVACICTEKCDYYNITAATTGTRSQIAIIDHVTTRLTWFAADA